MGLAVTKVNSKKRGSIRDTHARKMGTPTLSKEYQTVFEDTGKAMVIVEEDATISLANAEFEKLSGYTKGEIEGKKSWTEFVVRDDRKRLKEYHLLRRTDPMLAPRSFEFRFLDRHEKVKNIILTIGQIPGTSKSMASLQDVTDRRQAEETEQKDKKALADFEHQTAELVRTNEALQAEIADLKSKVKKLEENEKLYRNLVENVDFGINLIDADHTIMMVNAVQNKWFNKPLSDFIGKKCFREFEKRDAVCSYCPGVKAMATGKSAEVETEAVRDDKSHFHVRVQAFPIFGQDGTVTSFVEVVEDITERKRMEETLRESEERFRRFADEASFEGFIVHDEGKILDVNKVFATMYGYERDELIGMNIFETIASEYRTTVSKSVQEKNEKPYKIISLRKDGSTFPVEIHAKPFPFHGRIVRVAAVRDITERMQMEEQLRQSEERFRTLVETMRVGLSAVDAKGVITYVNDQMCQMLGYTREEFIGHPTTDFQDEESRKLQEEMFAKRRKGVKDPTPYEITWVAKDGHKVNTIMTPTPGYSPGGEFTGSFAIFTDITERKEMEEQLQKSEALYRKLIETTKVGVSAINENGVITYANDRHCEIWGYPLNEIIGHRVSEFLDEENLKILQDQLATRKEGARDPYEIAWRRKDGQNVSTILAPTPIFDAYGHFKGSYGFLTDITERKRMEEALRESEERFKRLADNTPFGITIMAPDKTFEYLNPKFTKIFGYTKEDIPDKDTWFVKAYPDEKYRKKVSLTWKRDMTENVRLGEENQRVFNVRCKNGEDKIIDFRSVDSKDGKQYLVYDDITDRINAEEALRESEERFRRLIETTKVGVSAIDEKGVIIYANERLSEMWGCPIDEIIRHSAFDFLDEENLKILKEHLAERKKGGSESYEITWTRKDGSKVPTILSPTPIFDTDGRYKGSYGFITDITERRTMEESLKLMVKQLGALGRASQVVTATLALDDVLREIVSLANEAVASDYTSVVLIDESGHLTRSADNMPNIPSIERRIREQGFTHWISHSHKALIIDEIGEDGAVVSPDDLDEGVPRFADIKLVEAGIKSLAGLPLIVKDCLLGVLYLHGRRPAVFKGQLNLLTTFANQAAIAIENARLFEEAQHELTERKRIEERLKRYAADLKRSNEEVKNFAYIVSHDLRVPLVNLKGYTSELCSALEVIGPAIETTLPHLSEDKRPAVAMALHEDVPEALEFITSSVSSMDSFINSVLILSRLGRRELKPEPIDMNALVKMSLENLSYQIQERGTTVTVGTLPQVVADRTAMEQIMGNILGNAVKYLDPERPGQIEVTAETNNGEQIFRIRDNGRGIAEEDMHKVFAPFRRAGKQDTPGEGMGLAYVQTLVRRQDGRIWCESEPGKGTTFIFTIAQHRAERGDHVAH